MSSTPAFLQREYFSDLCARILGDRKPGEHLFTGLGGEQSQFVRLNAARVRQIGTVEDATLELPLVLEGPDGKLRTAPVCVVFVDT